MNKYFVGACALLFLVLFSGIVTVYVFSGLLMFGGIVALCESMPPLKYLMARTSNVIDILIFIFGIYAMSTMGVTVAIGLSVAGLLFSVYYKPYLKKTLPVRPRKRKAEDVARECRMGKARASWAR